MTSKLLSRMFAAALVLSMAAAGSALAVVSSTTRTVVADPVKAASYSEITLAANRLVALQNTNGSWDWTVTGQTGPTANTFYNVTGVTAEGLLDAYTLTKSATYLDAAKKAGDFIVATPIAPTQRQNAYNAVFLLDLFSATGDATYSAKAGAILSSITDQENYWTGNAGNNCTMAGCTAPQLAAAYMAYRGAPVTAPDGIVAWDLEPFVEVATRTGNTAFATALEQEITNYLSAPAFTAGVPNYALGLAAGVRARADVGGSTATFAAPLAAAQDVSGFVGSAPGDRQATAYALLAFVDAGDAAHALSAATYLNGVFGYSGLNGWLESDGNEYGEVDSEAVHALFARTYAPNVYYTISDAITAASAGDTIAVGAGTYAENPDLTKALTVTGSGATITGQVTINAAGSTVSGFTVNNPNGNFGILINGVGNATVSGNTVSHVGTGTATGNAYGIYFQDKDTTDAAGITISGNTVSDIGATTNGSNGGVGIGDSTGTSNITDVTISNNTITDVRANPLTVAPGKGAYGIILNHSSGAGTTVATITGNTVNGLSGRWAHAIALEGNTPGTVVAGNTVSNVTSSKAQPDAVGLTFESNAGASSVSVHGNSFDAATVAWGVTNVTGNLVDVTANYWATSTPANIMYSAPANMIAFSPWYSDAAMKNLAFSTTGTNPSSNTLPSGITATTTAGGITAVITIPAGVTFSGPAGWNGGIELPVATSTYTLTPPAGFTVTPGQAFEVGSGDTLITFDKGIRISFAGQAGKFVGWSRGGVFAQVMQVCTADTQTMGDALPVGGDCYMNVGADLVVWTKHFTTYIPYTQTATSFGGSNGGGSSSPVATTTPAAPVAVTPVVVPAASTTTPVVTRPGTVLGAEVYRFLRNLRYGMRADDVTELQKRFTSEGVYTGPVTGYFGRLTLAAAKEYQKRHTIVTTGFVGPLTRGALNAAQ